MKMPRIALLAFVLSLGAAAPGFDNPYDCGPGTQTFSCSIAATATACQQVCTEGSPEPKAADTICAVNKFDAALLLKEKYTSPQWSVNVYQCFPTKGGPVGFMPPKNPPKNPQGSPSCELSAGDDACVACAKASCCGEYQACTGDPNCLCWVGCEYAGNTVDVCAQPANCGPLSDASSAAATCLTDNCPAECGTMGTMSGACMCGTVSAGAGGAGTGGSPFGGGGSPFGGGAP